MKPRILLLGALLATLGACADQPAAVEGGRQAAPDEHRLVRDDAVGVSLTLPEGWTTRRDPVLFDDSHGFLVSGEDRDPLSEGPHDRDAIARVALVRGAGPERLEALVQAQFRAHEMIPGLRLDRAEVEVGEGLRGVVVTGIPAPQPYSVVYVAAGGRVYEIGLWTERPGLDARAHELLRSLRFTRPTRSLESLGLQGERESLQWEPQGELALRNGAAQAERKRLMEPDVRAGFIRLGVDAMAAEPAPVRAASVEAALNCGILAPYGTDMQWQTQWDGSARFYSGSPGWTRMSGNGGSWWGQGFHVSCDDPYYHNQQYANDWPLQFGANVYSHFSGTVRYAGWAKGGHYTLGRIVIVRSGKWSSLSAHLNGWGSGISAGAAVDAPWTVIGYAGNSDGGAGYDWAPHLHSRVTWGETYNGYGMPIGGSAVMPRAFRCYECTDHDERTPDGRRWYTVFYQNRWMKY